MWYGQYGEMWEETEDETVYLLTIITVTYRYTNRYLPLFDEGNNEEGEKYNYLVMRWMRHKKKEELNLKKDDET